LVTFEVIIKDPDLRGHPVDIAVAGRWGRLLAEIDRPVAIIENFLAAIALYHELQRVTIRKIDTRRSLPR